MSPDQVLVEAIVWSASAQHRAILWAAAAVCLVLAVWSQVKNARSRALNPQSELCYDQSTQREHIQTVGS